MKLLAFCVALSAAGQSLPSRPDTAVAQPTWYVTYGDGTTLSDGEIRSAIEVGSCYNSRSHYLSTALTRNRVKIASAFARDGVSKYITFISDYEMVAAAAASAKQD